MGYTVLIFCAALLFVGFTAWLTVRDDGGPSPRRRQVKRLRADLAAARLVLRDVEEKIDLYRPSLDEVGLGLAQDVITIIRNYDRSILEDDQRGNKSD